MDYGGNYCVLKSFQLTSALSVILISSTSCISAMFLSIIFLRKRYDCNHAIGTIIVVAGIVLINISKYLDTSEREFEIIGTILATVASLCFAASRVLQEYLVRAEGDRFPFGVIFALGFVGSALSAVISNGTPFGREDRDSLLTSTDPNRWFSIGYISAMTILQFGK